MRGGEEAMPCTPLCVDVQLPHTNSHHLCRQHLLLLPTALVDVREGAPSVEMRSITQCATKVLPPPPATATVHTHRAHSCLPSTPSNASPSHLSLSPERDRRWAAVLCGRWVSGGSVQGRGSRSERRNKRRDFALGGVEGQRRDRLRWGRRSTGREMANRDGR